MVDSGSATEKMGGFEWATPKVDFWTIALENGLIITNVKTKEFSLEVYAKRMQEGQNFNQAGTNILIPGAGEGEIDVNRYTLNDGNAV